MIRITTSFAIIFVPYVVMTRCTGYMVLLFLLTAAFTAHAQLNGPEKIFLDSVSIYPKFGFQIEDKYLIGGEETSCRQATIWLLDKNFNVLKKKRLIHDYYEISEVYDMKVGDSSIEVLTRQLEIEDVGSDDGIKWYSLNRDLEIVDSIYIPAVDSYKGVIADSTWIVKTWYDSLLSISPIEGKVLHKIHFANGYNDLIQAGSKILSWRDRSIFIVDSSWSVDTVSFDEKVLKIESFPNGIFVLTEDHLWMVSLDGGFAIRDSTISPRGAESILYHAQLSSLLVFSEENDVYFYDSSLHQTGFIGLFYDPVHDEELYYRPVEDGSILRLGTTTIEIPSRDGILFGQELGFIHRFDQDYAEDFVQRSEVLLKELTLLDTYYGSKPKYILGDTVYIITKGNDSHLKWKVVNAGSDTIHSILVATDALWGFNCAEAYNSYLVQGALFAPGDSLVSTFEVYQNSYFPNGWGENRLVYSAYPNNHYDAAFSNNFRLFKFRYIISNASSGADPIGVKIYPNPGNDFINVSVPTGYGIRKAGVFNTRGVLISTIPIGYPGNTIRFKAPGSDGMYLLRLQVDGVEVIKKVMVVH